MQIRGIDLYKALHSLGNQPKTLEIVEMAMVTDTLTGKQKKRTIQTQKHALITVKVGKYSTTVSYDVLKPFARAMKKVNMTLKVPKEGTGLEISYGSSTVRIEHIAATASATLDLNVIRGNDSRMKWLMTMSKRRRNESDDQTTEQQSEIEAARQRIGNLLEDAAELMLEIERERGKD